MLNRQRWKTAAAVALGILAGAFFMELGAAALYAVDKGGLVWTRATPPRVSVDLRVENDKRIRLHPYVGYTGRRGMKLASVMGAEDIQTQFGDRFAREDFPTLGFNNHGFLARVDYPYVKAADEFVVGVFGGSVAVQFSLTAHHVLSEALEVAGVLKGRKLVLLDFAHGGAKQPQQATALAYFLALGQRFDYVITLDGFNEAFIGWYNMVEHAAAPEMPFARFVLGIQNIDLSEAGSPVGGSEHRSAALASRNWGEREQGTRSGIVWLVSSIVARHARSRLAEIERKATTKAESFDYSMPLLAAPPGGFAEVGVPRIASIWRDASIAMKGMCDRLGIPYLHVLQPNQYALELDYGGSEAERKRVRGLDHPPVSEFVPMIYRAYRAQAPALSAAGIDLVDGGPPFEGKPSRLFHDNCCHLNYDGNAILAQLIAGRMLRAGP